MSDEPKTFVQKMRERLLPQGWAHLGGMTADPSGLECSLKIFPAVDGDDIRPGEYSGRVLHPLDRNRNRGGNPYRLVLAEKHTYMPFDGLKLCLVQRKTESWGWITEQAYTREGFEFKLNSDPSFLPPVDAAIQPYVSLLSRYNLMRPVIQDINDTQITFGAEDHMQNAARLQLRMIERRQHVVVLQTTTHTLDGRIVEQPTIERPSWRPVPLDWLKGESAFETIARRISYSRHHAVRDIERPSIRNAIYDFMKPS